jgi:hypothetical protein
VAGAFCGTLPSSRATSAALLDAQIPMAKRNAE